MIILPPPIREKMVYASYIKDVEKQQNTVRAQYHEFIKSAEAYHRYEIIRMNRAEAFQRFYDDMRKQTFIAEIADREHLEYVYFHRGPEDEYWVSKLELQENKPFIRNNPLDHRDIFLDEYRMLIESKKGSHGLEHPEKEKIEEIQAEQNQSLLLIPTKFHSPPPATALPDSPDVTSAALTVPLIAALFLQFQTLPAKAQLRSEHQINDLQDSQNGNRLDLDLRK